MVHGYLINSARAAVEGTLLNTLKSDGSLNILKDCVFPLSNGHVFFSLTWCSMRINNAFEEIAKLELSHSSSFTRARLPCRQVVIRLIAFSSSMTLTGRIDSNVEVVAEHWRLNIGIDISLLTNVLYYIIEKALRVWTFARIKFLVASIFLMPFDNAL